MPKQTKIKNLWKGTYNKIIVKYPGDVTGKTWEWRFKRELEDITQPIKQGTVVVDSTSSTLSVGHIDFNLSDKPDLEGLFYLDFKIYTIPSYPSYSHALQVNVTPTLHP